MKYWGGMLILVLIVFAGCARTQEEAPGTAPTATTVPTTAPKNYGDVKLENQWFPIS